MLIEAAEELGNPLAVSYLRSMYIVGQFEPGEGETEDTSMTRNGYHPWSFGYGNRTILSEDYFDRPLDSQLETLLHESHHAGTDLEDTEEEAYRYADQLLTEIKKTEVYKDYVQQMK